MCCGLTKALSLLCSQNCPGDTLHIIIVVCISHDGRDSHYLALILQRALLVDQKTELQLELGQPLLVLTLQLLPRHLICQHLIP